MTATLLRPRGLDEAIALAAPQRVGLVTSAVGLGLTVAGVEARIGDVLTVGTEGSPQTPVEVVATDPTGVRCMPLGRLVAVTAGTPVRPTGRPVLVPTGAGLFGRVLDGLGRPIDDRGPLDTDGWVPLDHATPNAMARTRIDAPMQLGVRVLDTLTTVGRGQRMGLFAGSGVGKSSLLSMIARGSDAAVNVIALVGERGREVREFLEDDLGPEGLARSIVVVSTSDEPALMRLRAAFVATRIAESFRDAGQDVVLMMDSLTRVAMAQREIGLSVGEPPATRGYPPSTFSVLAGLLERAGTDRVGSITGLYTVLVDGDDHNEPIADSARSILDGHVVLDRKLAVTGHFPSVDALGSVSRVASKVTEPWQRAAATALRKVMAARRNAQDLLDVGAYQPGTNPLVDAAVTHQDAIDAFLRQGMDDRADAGTSWRALDALVARLGVSA
ncbi:MULTISPECIES: FliI/YscN family ATPase [unclassified Curtobacterium]|uniref:FliI/YscN family ATPase n=1 Tax=unclassified Curtobacterium TaxID=257496 RepID=UPI00052AC5B8|nr:MULTISPECIES: FliI/YscN family ATPase [unclassified Curtobacterium]AIV40083.1 ATP synthase [Curtobacterium sp. MR_MD2014]MBP1300461.1 flagellum-specific ATP synthase [Curtobacterium sp. 1310]MCM3506008.1 FliI/YscN family ATPase [Curtobacterium sp. ODYSSEY 48 V2]MCM3521697.1 FliI/YscN family ATPase [Curtobacterium sp. P97]MDB6426830.1 FliI/YscN family ATPase [Curtobacterium sp. 20TX0008]